MGDRRRARRRVRRRRLLALLAAGSVLGVGTVSTIAAWTDSETATGAFAASVFDTQSQSAGTPTYASHPTGGPSAALTFTAAGLSPGVATQAWLNIRTSPASTVGGTVALTGASSTGVLSSALEYRAVRLPAAVPTATCNAAAFSGSPVFIAGGASSYIPVTSTPSPAVANAIDAAGAQLGFCIEVRVRTGAENSFQGTSATVTWTFTGTSAS
ncbi:MAG: SipW-dependent-type signal peptide-containing protein [Microbacterium arborescens]